MPVLPSAAYRDPTSSSLSTLVWLAFPHSSFEMTTPLCPAYAPFFGFAGVFCSVSTSSAPSHALSGRSIAERAGGESEGVASLLELADERKLTLS